MEGTVATAEVAMRDGEEGQGSELLGLYHGCTCGGDKSRGPVSGIGAGRVMMA